jgi:hypothetical protein
MSPKYKLDRAKNSQVMACLNRMNYKFFYDMCFDLDCGCTLVILAICSERMAFENSRFFRVPTTVIIISFVLR